MMKRRVLAVLLAAALMMQGFGTSAYAAGITMPNENVVETVLVDAVALESEEPEETIVEESAIEQESVTESEDIIEELSETVTSTEEDTVIEETDESISSQEPETESSTSVMEEMMQESYSEEETTEEEIRNNAVYSESKNYLIDTELGIELSQVEVTPKNYSMDLTATLKYPDSSRYDNNDVYLLYTDDATKGNDFIPDVTSVNEEDINTLGYSIASCPYYWIDRPGSDGYTYAPLVNSYIVGKAQTMFYYRLACRAYDDTASEYKYYFLTTPDSFTTTEMIEESAISYADIEIEETGYRSAKLVWTLENPNDEPLIEDQKVYYADSADGEYTETVTARVYYGSDGMVENKYYADVPLIDESVKVKISSNVYTGSGVKTAVESADTVIERKELTDSVVSADTTVGTASISTSVTIAPWYDVDNTYNSGYMTLFLYYKAKSADTYSSKKSNISNGQCSVTAGDLTEKTEYEYYLEIRTGNSSDSGLLWAGGSAESPYSVTTKENITYEDSDFPDEVFRKIIKNKAGVGTYSDLTSADLEDITYLSLGLGNGGDEVIASIEGIQYLPNLTHVDFSEHSITDASYLGSLGKLEFITMVYNDLTQMPDLSGAEALKSLQLSGNRIDASTITEDKFPDGFLEANPDWIEECIERQNVEFRYSLAEKYYATGDAHPFFVDVVGIKPDMEYILSVEIDGNTVSTTTDEVRTGHVNDELEHTVVLIPDLLVNEDGTESGITITPGAVTATVVLKDEYDREYLNEKLTFTMEADIPVAREEYYINPSETSFYPWLYMGDHEAEEFKKIELVDKEGNVVGSSIDTSISTDSNGNRDYRYEYAYTNLFYLSNYTHNHISIYEEVCFHKLLSADDYDLKVTMTDGTIHMVEDVVHVSNQSLVMDYGQDSAYDNSGDYIYFRVNGYNMDTSKCYPVIYYEGVAITGEMCGVLLNDNSGSVTYKLKKLDSVAGKEDTYLSDCTVSFVTEEGYSIQDICEKKEFSISLNRYWQWILSGYYNEKKSIFELFLDSSVPEGTEITFSIMDSTYTNVQATATAKIANQKVELYFVDTEGNAYVPQNTPSSIYLKWQYVLNGEEKTDKQYINIKCLKKGGNTSNSDSYTIHHNTFPYQRTSLKELAVDVCVPTTYTWFDHTQSMDVEIHDSSGTKVGSSVNLPRKEVTIDGKTYSRYSGTWTNDIVLESNRYYYVRYFQNGSLKTSTWFWTYDNDKLYINSQDMQRQLEDVISVSIDSYPVLGELNLLYGEDVSNIEALQWWSANCQLSIFDTAGTAVSGWTVTGAAPTEEGMDIYVSGLSKEYIGYYFKVMDKDGNPVFDYWDVEHTYYADRYDSTEEFGQWKDVFAEGIEWLKDNYSSEYTGIRVSSLDVYPAKAIITKPNSSEILHEFSISDNQLTYYFSKEDLEGVAEDEIYRMQVIGANGVVSEETAYFVTLEEEEDGDIPTVNATGITLNQTEANMQLGESLQLTATVKPADATNKKVTWTSSDGTVATVDATGKVTAVAPGTATITAATYNDIKATCTVNVFNYSISKNELSFDLSGEVTSETLTVSNGVSTLTGITWNSSDISVATVDKNGKVTAVGVGATVITGAVQDGPTLTCNVTVERSKIEKIALSVSTLTLDKEQTETIKVYYVPNDVTCDKTIRWTSADEDIASVNENGMVTAKAKGETTIKATVKDTDISAECVVIVQDTVNEDTLMVPAGLSALTNVDKTLADISLDAYAGWTWQNPEIDLTKFAGYQEKTFMAVYQPDEYARAIYKEIPVKLSTVTGISLQAEQTTVLKDKTTNVALSWMFTGTEPDMSAYEQNIKWENSKESVASVGEGTTNVVVTALAKGNTTLKAVVTVGDKTYSKTIKLNVAEGNQADVLVTEVSGFAKSAQDSDYFTADKAEVSEGTINGTVVNATKLTVKSSNAKVLTVKNATVNADGTFVIPYNVKDAGTTKITLIANDALKTTKEIWLQVKDVTPSVSATAITVNRLSEKGESFFIYPGQDAPIESVILTGTGSEKFDFAYNNVTCKATIKTVDETTVTGKQDIVLLITLQDGSTKNATVKVTVNEKKPTFKIKQAKKLNLFMTNTVENAALTVTASDNVTSMTLNSECDFEIRQKDNNYYVAAKADGLDTGCNKTGVLTVTYENYRGTYTYNLKVAVEKKAPKITVDPKTAVIYPNVGIESANVCLNMNKAVLDLTDMQVRLTDTTDYSISVSESVITITRTNATQNKKVKANLVLTCGDWVEEVKVPVTLSVNLKAPKVKLSTKTVKVNSNPQLTGYDEAAVKVMWKDAADFEPEKITVTAANAASQKILNKGIIFAVEDDTVIVKQNREVASGNYSFKVNVSTASGYTASEKLTVKVTNTSLSKAIKVSAKGTIDVLNREGSFVTVTPTLSAVNGSVVDVQVSGKFAHLFEKPDIENGKIYLYVKEDAAVITKYNYGVNLILTIENASGDRIEVETAELKVKFKQGKPKFVMEPKKEVFYSNAYNSVEVDVAATLKGADNPEITNMELVNNTNGFDCSYDADTQKITVIMKENGEAVKGKKYTLQFRVSLKGQADNEKVNIIKYSVTVK